MTAVQSESFGAGPHETVTEGGPIFLVAHSEYRGVYIGAARKLRDSYGCPIHLYVATEQEAVYYRSRYTDLFASIEVVHALYSACREPISDQAAVLAEAQANEAELGITYGELAITDRHLGRGYALGGFRHPRSHISENTDQIRLLNGFNRLIGFWRQALDDRQPALLLNAGKVLNVLARSRGVPVRILAGSRYKSFYYWAINEYLESPEFEVAWQAAKPNAELSLAAPYDAHLRFRAKFRKDASLLRTLKTMASFTLWHIYWLLRGYEKAKGYYLTENVAYVWRCRRDIVRQTRRDNATLEQLKKSRFAFFPLATEPETALQTISPEFFFQLEAIAAISRDLPAGCRLAVKEHYAAVGRRPRDFYGQIAEFKNVVSMNMAELGLEAVRTADVVVTISGSSGFEGAVLGKPVISFGRHNIYNFLPHVLVVTDETDLKSYLARAFVGDFDNAQAERDGSRFLQAIINTSFDLDGFVPIRPDDVDQTALDAAVEALLASVGAANLLEGQNQCSATAIH